MTQLHFLCPESLRVFSTSSSWYHVPHTLSRKYSRGKREHAYIQSHCMILYMNNKLTSASRAHMPGRRVQALRQFLSFYRKTLLTNLVYTAILWKLWLLLLIVKLLSQHCIKVNGNCNFALSENSQQLKMSDAKWYCKHICNELSKKKHGWVGGWMDRWLDRFWQYRECFCPVNNFSHWELIINLSHSVATHTLTNR